MRVRVYLLIVILIAVFQSLLGQDLVVFSESEKKELSYSLDASNSSETSDYFVNEIAKGIPRNPQLVSYSASFNVESKVIKFPKNQYRVLLQIADFKPTKDYHYRGFDLSSIIFPKHISGKISWKDNNTNKISSAVYDDVREELFTTYIIWSKDILDESGEATFTIDSYTLHFAFDESQKEEFDKVINAIDDYYDSGFLLDDIESRLARVDLENANMLLIYNIQLKTIRKDLQLLKPENFYQDNEQLNYDPIGLGKRHQLIMNKIDSLKNGIEERMNTLDQSYYLQAVTYLNQGDTINAGKLFKRSIRINPYYSPSYYYLALIEMEEGALDTSVVYIRNILTNLKPDYEVKKKTIELAKECSSRLSKKALRLSKQEDYNQAVAHLDIALLLCDSTPFVECSDEVNQAMAEAKYGLYNSYLSVANTALQHNLKLVEGYLDLAYKYQQDNRSYIITSAEVDSLYVNLLGRYQELAQNYLNEKEYGYALSYSDKSLDLCARLPHLKCDHKLSDTKAEALGEVYKEMIERSLTLMRNDGALSANMYLNDAIAFQKEHSEYIPTTQGTDTILNRVRRNVFVQHVEKVKYYKEEGRFQMAVDHIRKAKAIEKDFPSFKSSELDEMIEDLMVPMLLSDLKYPYTKSWGKHYKLAKSVLEDVVQRMNKYHIDNQELNVAIEATDYYIRITSCTDLSKEYKNQIRRANTQMQNGDYLNASEYWGKALSIARENPYCGLDTVGLIRYFNNYKPVIQFQKTKSSAESAYQKGDYTRAIEYYWEAQLLSDSIGLKKYRIYHIQFTSWVDGKLNDTSFMDALLGVLSEKGELDLAMKLWTKHIKHHKGIELSELHKAFIQSLAIQDAKIPSNEMKARVACYFPSSINLENVEHHYRYYFLNARSKTLSAKVLRIRYKIK